MRATALAAAALVASALALVLLGTTAAPLTRTCAAGMSETACSSAVSAVLRRGLPALHPLILGAHVEPGPEPDPDQLGHRATVVLDLLAPVRAVRIELHSDQGAHWGGVIDRGPMELAAWALAPLVVAALIGAGLVAYGRRRTLTAWRASKTR
ncbi:hypothetical protein BH23CHL8_BH23CHL8_17180 [soil metagenome]